MWDSAVCITSALAAFENNYALLSTNQKGTGPIDQLATKAKGHELMDKLKMRDFVERLHEVGVKNV